MEGEQKNKYQKPTIVGVRPPEGRVDFRQRPIGIEILLKKASVDHAFRETLISQRGKAAEAIFMQLEPEEEKILSAIPESQLLQMIEKSVVPAEQKPAFEKYAAALMIAAMGLTPVLAAGCAGKRIPVEPSEIKTNTATPTQAQPSGTSTAVSSHTLTATVTSTMTPTASATAMGIMTDTPTASPSPTATASATPTADIVVSSTATNTPVVTATAMGVLTNTYTATPTVSSTPVVNTPSPSATSMGIMATPTPTSTVTP